MTTPEPTPADHLAELRVLELMDEAWRAAPAGEPWKPFSRDAAVADYVTYIKVQGAMRSGAIPNPDVNPSEWMNYLDTVRDEVARARKETGGNG